MNNISNICSIDCFFLDSYAHCL